MFDDFLNNLVGFWDLTGKMGSVELMQKVRARWIIQGHFLEVHCVQEEPVPQGRTPYEAIYVLSCDSRSGEYSMHLFDTFGAGYARTIGFGTRKEDTVEFIFEYPNGIFSNAFTWNREADTWEMLLRQKQEDGQWKLFASKSLVRDQEPATV